MTNDNMTLARPTKCTNFEKKKPQNVNLATHKKCIGHMNNIPQAKHYLFHNELYMHEKLTGLIKKSEIILKETNPNMIATTQSRSRRHIFNVQLG